MMLRLARSWSNAREIRSLLANGATPFVRRHLALVVVLVITAAALTPLGPYALKLIVDSFSQTSGQHPFSIGAALALYAASQWIAPAITQVRGLVYARAERRLLTNVSYHFFGHVLKLPYLFHTRSATGAIQQSLENGRQGCEMVLHHFVFTILPVAAQLATTIWILARLDQPLFLALFCLAALCDAAAFTFFVVRAIRAAEEASEANIKASAVMTDSILALAIVKLFTGEKLVRERIFGALRVTEQQQIRFYRFYAINGLIVSAVFAAFLLTVMWFSAQQVSMGRMSVGELVLVNSYMLQLLQPVEMVGYAIQGLSQGAAMMNKMLALLRQNPEGAEARTNGTSIQVSPQNPATPLRRPASLEFRDVSLSYEEARQTIRKVSFSAPSGHTLALVGPSGIGKSTIGYLAARLIEPDDGMVLLDDIPSFEYPLEEWRRAVGVIPQEGGALFNESIAFNIGFGRPGCSHQDIERAAKLAHLHEFIVSLPEGYKTKVGERGVQLSGGQRQRIAIARAAIKQPRLYVIDEGTSSLDSRTEADIMRNLRQISRTTTTLIIAHRLSTIVHADQILVLDAVGGAGEIVERGTHLELLARSGRYAALWNAQHTGMSKTSSATTETLS